MNESDCNYNGINRFVNSDMNHNAIDQFFLLLQQLIMKMTTIMTAIMKVRYCCHYQSKRNNDSVYDVDNNRNNKNGDVVNDN